MPALSTCLIMILALLLVACGSPAPRVSVETQTIPRTPAVSTPAPAAGEVVMYAMSLIDTGYRFGGKNPEAGLDCSGMVSYIYDQALGMKVQGSAADMARLGRSIRRQELRPGDLVFFNTRNKPNSHVGIYIGDGRFIHAPSSQGRIRIEMLSKPYFAQRFEMARTLLD